jgi:hypothetical protein
MLTSAIATAERVSACQRGQRGQGEQEAGGNLVNVGTPSPNESFRELRRTEDAELALDGFAPIERRSFHTVVAQVYRRPGEVTVNRFRQFPLQDATEEFCVLHPPTEDSEFEWS